MTAFAAAAAAAGAASAAQAATPAQPSFSCAKVKAGSIEQTICQDAELATLDNRLAAVYAAATRKAVDEHPPVLKAEQRGWIKGRNDCWKAPDRRDCVQTQYVQRIAELQARYRLVPGIGPVRYACGGSPADEVVATYFQTDPPTLIAERGDSTSLMFVQRSGSGARYEGRNTLLWEHQGEALIRWGDSAPEMTCRKQ